MLDHPIFRRSDLLLQNLFEVIDQPAFDGSARILASGNSCQLSIEHGAAFRALAEQRMFASAFVVLRSQFESALRAVWLLYSAKDDQIEKISAPLGPDAEQAAKNLPGSQDMLAELGRVPRAAEPHRALSEFKDVSWRALNSFTHTGLHPLRRHVDGYPLDLIYSTVKISNALTMLAGMQFAILTGVPGLQRSILSLNERYPDCVPLDRQSST